MSPLNDWVGLPVVSPLLGAGVHVIVAVPLPAERAADASLKTKMPTITTAITITAPTSPMIIDRWRFFGRRVRSTASRGTASVGTASGGGCAVEPLADPDPSACPLSGTPPSALTCSPILGAASARTLTESIVVWPPLGVCRRSGWYACLRG